MLLFFTFQYDLQQNTVDREVQPFVTLEVPGNKKTNIHARFRYGSNKGRVSSSSQYVESALT